MAEEKDKKSPRDILRIILSRRKLLLLGSALFAVAWLIAAHHVLPLKYTAQAKFTRRIDPASEQLVGSKSESFDTRKLTLQNDLAGYKAVERVVEDLNLTKDLPRTSEGRLTVASDLQKQEIVRTMMKAIKVDWEVSSQQIDLISVSCTHADPELAMKVPNALVNNYIGWVSDQTVSRLRDSEEFLKEQRDRLKEQVDTANGEKIKFEVDHANAMPGRVDALEDQIRKLTSDIDVVRRQHDLAEKKLARYMSMAHPATMPSTGPGATSEPTTQAVQWVKGPNPEVDRLTNLLRDAKEALSMMIKVRGMKETHPDVQAQQRTIEQLEERLKNTPTDIIKETVYSLLPTIKPGETRVDLSVEIASVQSDMEMAANEIQRMEARLKEYQNLQVNFAPVQQKYGELLKKLAEKEAEMRSWDSRYMEVEMQLAAESAKKRIQNESVLAAQPQSKPSSPSLLMVLGVAIVGGLGFGAGLVFLSNLMNRSIMTSDDAAKYFHMPVHGTIGEIVTDSQRMARKLKAWIATPIIVFIVLAALGLSSLNVLLWLNAPEAYKEWQQSPTAYMSKHVRNLVP